MCISLSGRLVMPLFQNSFLRHNKILNQYCCNLFYRILMFFVQMILETEKQMISRLSNFSRIWWVGNSFPLKLLQSFGISSSLLVAKYYDGRMLFIFQRCLKPLKLLALYLLFFSFALCLNVQSRLKLSYPTKTDNNVLCGEKPLNASAADISLSTQYLWQLALLLRKLFYSPTIVLSPRPKDHSCNMIARKRTYSLPAHDQIQNICGESIDGICSLFCCLTGVNELVNG